MSLTNRTDVRVWFHRYAKIHASYIACISTIEDQLRVW